MPDLNSTLHVDMLKESKRRYSLLRRLYAAGKNALHPPIYGTEWGDLEAVPPLAFVLQRYLLPYVNRNDVALEIGPGGGRWTKHLTDFGKLYAIDYHAELLKELNKNFASYDNIVFIKNNGSDFPGVTENSVDFLFSFGTFVHLDFPLIESYLQNIKPIIKNGANVVIQYSDKTKIMARENIGFSENTPERMREAVHAQNYRILEEDVTTLWHSSIIRFTR